MWRLCSEMLHEYFETWRLHNVGRLRDIFSADARYLILPRRRRLKGLSEIEQYWSRNAQRQGGLEVSWRGRDMQGFSVAAFKASFLDSSEGAQCISGVLLIVGRPLARVLVEYYWKSRK